MRATMLLLATSNGVGGECEAGFIAAASTSSLPDGSPSISSPSKKSAVLPRGPGSSIFFGPTVLRHLLCLHLHLHPHNQNLLLARDAIINPPVVGVKRRRDEGG